MRYDGEKCFQKMQYHMLLLFSFGQFVSFLSKILTIESMQQISLKITKNVHCVLVGKKRLFYKKTNFSFDQSLKLSKKSVSFY